MSDTEDERTISDAKVLQKYKYAGEVCTIVGKKIIEKIVDGASVRQICVDGEEQINEEVKNILKKEKNLKKGIAFPVCVCVNNCINHFSPLFSDDDLLLKNGDVAKLDMGVHIDGFASTLSHTVVVGASEKNPVEGRKADVILAAHYALRAAIQMLKPGNTNYSVTDTVLKVAESYKCTPIQGMMSFQLQDGTIEGEKIIIQNPTEGQRKEVEKTKFKSNEVYGIDSVISSGAGKGREMESRTTIYKKSDEVYKLKLKTSKEFFSKVYKEFNPFPFNLRNFQDEKRARMGVQECVSHRLVEPYPVMYEKPNEIVAQFKTTVLLTGKNVVNISMLDFNDNLFKSEHKIEDEDLLKLISQYGNPPKKKTKQNKRKPIHPNKNDESKNQSVTTTDANKENSVSDSGNKDYNVKQTTDSKVEENAMNVNETISSKPKESKKSDLKQKESRPITTDSN